MKKGIFLTLGKFDWWYVILVDLEQKFFYYEIGLKGTFGNTLQICKAKAQF